MSEVSADLQREVADTFARNRLMQRELKVECTKLKGLSIVPKANPKYPSHCDICDEEPAFAVSFAK